MRELGELNSLAAQIRGKVIELSHKAETPHLGGSLSCVDILVVAYWNILKIDPTKPDDPDRDFFIFSKGHAATAFYATLSKRGFFPDTLLMSYAQPGTALAEHPSPRSAPGIEAGTGSLGHGLPIGIGLALANRLQGKKNRVFVLMSDGECNEGSVWEAAMFAPAQKLNSLCVIVDYNKWQATGRSQEIMSMDPLHKKWEAFGWNCEEVDGHDINQITNAMAKTPRADQKPTAIVAHTVKGKGVSFMENDNNWHYRIPTADEVGQARKELKLV